MNRKLLWKDGLPLQQHIWECADEYYERLLAERMALIDYAWGLDELEWDPQALRSGQVALRGISGILPDGTPFEWTGDVPLTRTIDDDAAVINVYVGIPRGRLRDQSENGQGEPLPGDRYVKESRLVTQLATGEVHRVECLRPNVSLLLQGDRLDDYVHLPCAQLLRDEGGQFYFATDFIAPVLSLRASPFAMARLQQLLDELLDCRKDLEGWALREAADVARRSALGVIGAAILLVRNFLQQPRPHPLAVYRALCQSLGQLAAYSTAGHADIPDFRYERLGWTFSVLFENLLSVLEALSSKPYRRIPLQHVKDGKYRAELREATIFRNDFIVAVVGNETDVPWFHSHISNLLTVAAWSQLDQFTAVASSGVGLVGVRTPAKLPDVRGTAYFQLTKNDAFKAIFKTGALGLFRRSASQIREVILYAVEPDESTNAVTS